MSVTLGIIVGLCAATDWWAVAWQKARVEVIAKPAVMVALIGLALAVDAEPGSARLLMIIGLGWGLAGDVFLLPGVNRFLAGLGSFLVGHLFYAAALATMDLALIGVVGGVTAAAVVLFYLGRPVVVGVRGSKLFVPVTVYMASVGVLVVLGTATHRWPIAIGGVLFAVSDGLLGHDRFVRSAPERRVVVHITYHLAQFGLVLGLARTFA